MNFKQIIFFILFIFSFFLSSEAQSGCLVPGGDVYTQGETAAVNAILALLIGPGYKGTPTSQYGPCVNLKQNVYIPNNSLNCRVCPGVGFSVVGLAVVCNTATINGKVASIQVLNCPLDDYAFPLTATAGVLGLFFIRRKLR